MTKRSYVLATALVGCLAAPTVMAQGNSPLHFGAKVGLMDADFGGFDEGISIGVQLGYDLFTEPYGTITVEGEYTTTLSDGDIAGGGEWDADTLAIYGAFRTAGDGYLKAKAGWLDQDIKRRGGGGGTITNGDDSSFAYGVGAGWRVNRLSAFELEYTVMSDELSFISLGYLTRF